LLNISLFLEHSQKNIFFIGLCLAQTKPGGPAYPFPFGSSPVTWLALKATPISTLPPAQLPELFDHTSPTTTLQQ